MGEVIAMDIGGTHMRIALVRGRKIVKIEVIDTPKTKTIFLKTLCGLIDKYNSSKVRGIGIGIGGPVFNGKVLDTPNIPLKKFDLKKYVSKKYKKKVGVDNDVNCFALAELKAGSKDKNFILVAVGTGIGGGIVINGEIVRGRGYAGEFGVMNFGNRNWEDEWNESKKMIEKGFGKEVRFSDLLKKRSRKGDLILKKASADIAKGLASLDAAFDPEVFYLGGGIRESGRTFLKMIQKEYDERIFFKNRKKIKWVTLDNEGLIGASLLV